MILQKYFEGHRINEQHLLLYSLEIVIIYFHSFISLAGIAGKMIWGIDAYEMGNEFWMLTTNVQVRGVESKCQEHSSVCWNDVAICLQSCWDSQLCMLRGRHAVN